MVAFARANGAIPPGARDVILVSTLEPCVMCTGAAMETAVDTIVYGLEAPADSGSTRVRPPDGPDSQMPRIVGGVLRDESRALFEEWLRVNGNAEQRPYVELLLAGTRAGA
jgi:tRNA(adenine34) deaminase